MQNMESKSCKQIFLQDKIFFPIWLSHSQLKNVRCTGGETKVIRSEGKIRHSLNLSEKVFYGGDTNFSYTACQWSGGRGCKNR